MKRKYLESSCLFVLILMFLAVLFPAGAFAQSETKTIAATADESVMGVAYRGHVQNYGNMPKPEGTMIAGPNALGTTGEGLRLEGFWIDLTGDVPANGDISYQVHVQNIGWQDAVDSGNFAGTDRRGLRIEAIKISLVNLPDYDVYYRGHVQNVGNIPQIDGDWGWVKNGEELGTTNRGLRLEELQIKIVRKGIDLTAYNTLRSTIEKLDAANYSPESWAVLQTALTDHKITEANSQASIDAATQAIQAAYDALSLKVVAVYDKPGVYGPETGTQIIEGSVIIDVSGVTLQNLVIKGDLTVSEAVGNGDATLNNLTVEGTTVLAGGGTGGATLTGLATSGEMALAENSGGITIDGGDYNRVQISKKDNGGIQIIMKNNVTGNIEIIDAPEGQPIILKGQFKGIGIQAPDIKLDLLPGTTIGTIIAGSGNPYLISAAGLVVTGSGTVDNFTIHKPSSNVNVGAGINVGYATIDGGNATFNGAVGTAYVNGKNAVFGSTVKSAVIFDNSNSFAVAPGSSLGVYPPNIVSKPTPPGGGGTVLTTPATPVMQAYEYAATGAGKFFVVSAPGTDNTKTKLTFTYASNFGGTLEYAIVANGASPSSWANVPATGVQSDDLAATDTGDLYVRIKAVAGTSNASAEVKALDTLTVGLTTPTLNVMETDAEAVDAAGKWFVSSAAGADNNKTKLTFTYNGLLLEYAIVAHGASPSSWTNVPESGEVSADLEATETGDLYVRITAVAGTSNASAAVKALDTLTVGLTTPTLNAMETSAEAVDAAGKWFVSSAAGADNNKTKLTFTYNGLLLEYAIVAHGASPSSWTNVPESGEVSADLEATETGDLYVRITAVAGTSNASAAVKALDALTLGI